MLETKICSKCKQEFPKTREFFYGDKRSKDELISCCKACQLRASARWSAAHKEIAIEMKKHWRAANPDKMQAARDRWAENNADRISEVRQARRAAHPEIFRQRQREFRANNPNYSKNYARMWRLNHLDQARKSKQNYWKNHPERVKALNRARYARKRGAEGKHTEADILQQLALQEFQCCWCHKSLDGVYTIDHLISLDRGGSNWPENIVIACGSCNSSKNNRHVFLEWLPPYLFI